MVHSTRILKDLFRLLWLWLVLLLLLLLVGPLLVIAAVVGRLALPGGMVLEPGKHNRRGRVWAFGVGLLLWVTIWGGGIWLGLGGQLPVMFPDRWQSTPWSARSAVPLTTTPTIRVEQSPTPIATPTPTSTAVPAPLASTSTPKHTPTSPPPTPTSTPLPSPSPTPTPTAPVRPTETSTPVVDTAGAIQAVTVANILLRRAIVTPNAQNLDALASSWQATALLRVQDFARQMNRKYHSPLTVTYETIGELQVHLQSDPPQPFVQSREIWTFEGSNGKRTAVTAYKYILRNDNNHWVIVDYQFEVLPLQNDTSKLEE